DAFERVVSETIHPDMLTPEITIDAEVHLSEITPKFFRILKQFEPFGPQNMTPIFLTGVLTDTGYAKRIGANEEHLKLYVKQSDSDSFSAIGFGLGDKIELVTRKQSFAAAFSVEENE